MGVCDEVLLMINDVARTPREFNYLQHYIGLRSHGVVKNLVWFSPKPTKKIVHVGFRNQNAGQWKDRFEEAGMRVPTQSKRIVRVSLTPDEFSEHQGLIREAVEDTIKEFDA